MKKRNINLMIYLNHTLSSAGDRMWDFALGLYLVILYPDSLILAATLGLSMCLGVIIFGSTLGKWIDRNPRLKVAVVALLVENSFVILGAVLLALNIVYKEEIRPIFFGYFQFILFAFIILSAVIGNLGSSASDIVIERDWIVVLSQGDNDKLSSLNSTMRSIDLTTNILSPFIMGQVITFGTPLAGPIFIGVWNFLSAIIEYKLLLIIHKNVPELAEKPHQEQQQEERDRALNFKGSVHGWKLYFKHPVSYAGLSFALLFLTVMGFDSITLGYIYSQGASESFIGIVTCVGAIFGILGSLTFPYLRSNFGKYCTGNMGFGLNVIFLLFCVGSVFAPGSPFDPSAIGYPFSTPDGDRTHEAKTIAQLWTQNLNIFYFVIGIILARLGLWLADLSVTQIIQEGVEECNRGVISGVQSSLNQIINMIKFILIILLPSIEAFGFLIFLSWFAVFLALVFFNVYICTSKTLSRCPSMEDLMGESKPLLSKKVLATTMKSN